MAPPAAELKAMTDAFEGIDRLAEGAPRTDGAPNFRRVRTHAVNNVMICDQMTVICHEEMHTRLHT